MRLRRNDPEELSVEDISVEEIDVPEPREPLLSKKSWIVGGATLTLVVAAVAIITVLLQSSPAPIKPTTVTAELAEITETVTGKGTVQPANLANAAFQTDGQITSMLVSIGQTVTAGQNLATIDSTTATLALDTKRATLATSQLTLDAKRAARAVTVAAVNDARERLASLPDDASYTEARNTLTTAQSQITSDDAAIAEAELARDNAAREVTAAQATLDATTLKAPIAGVVTAINGTVGSNSGSQTPSASDTTDTADSNTATSPGSATTSSVVTIADTSSLFVVAAVAENDIDRVQIDQTATINLTSSDNKEAAGTITAIAPMPKSKDGAVTYQVTIRLTEPPAGIFLGQTGNAEITVASATDAITLPVDAVNRIDETSGTVDVLSKGKTTTVEVTLGLANATTVQILDGISADQKVVVTAPTEPLSEPDPMMGR